MDETERVWNIPHEDAAEIVTRLYDNATDAAQLSFARDAMPKWQADIQSQVKWVADAIEMGLVTQVGVDQLETAIAHWRASRKPTA